MVAVTLDAQAQIGGVGPAARLGQRDGEQSLALRSGCLSQGVTTSGVPWWDEDLAVQRGEQVDIGDAEVGAGDFLVDHSGGEAAEAQAAKLLGQFGRDEAHLAHLPHQFTIENAGLVALLKAGGDTVRGKSARLLGQR